MNGKEIAVAGAEPNVLSQRIKMAEMLAESDVVPSHFKGKAGNLVAVMQAGSELGIPPMSSIKTFFPTKNNDLGMYAEKMLAIVMAQPDYAGKTEDFDKKTNTFYFSIRRQLRTGDIEQSTGKFSFQDAINAGLVDKDVWKKYPERMLRSRAMAFACRGAYPDKLAGFYTEAELEAKDVDVQEQASTDKKLWQKNPEMSKGKDAPPEPEESSVNYKLEEQKIKEKFNGIIRSNFKGRDEIVAKFTKLEQSGIKDEESLKQAKALVTQAMKSYIVNHPKKAELIKIVNFVSTYLPDVQVSQLLCDKINKSLKQILEDIPVDTIITATKNLGKKLEKHLKKDEIDSLLQSVEKHPSKEEWFRVYHLFKKTLKNKGGK